MILIGTDNVPLEIPEEMEYLIMSFWDVPTLVQNKAVCRRWKRVCTAVIDQKEPVPRKAFETSVELRSAIKRYKVGAYAETLASTYGWPIDKWDVSRIQDFSLAFTERDDFNDVIGSWDVSNATHTNYMFRHASSFNQDLSSWDTSNVRYMNHLFYHASSFNQDLSSWDTSNATTDTEEMFEGTAVTQSIMVFSRAEQN
jgi:surface protein